MTVYGWHRGGTLTIHLADRQVGVVQESKTFCGQWLFWDDWSNVPLDEIEREPYISLALCKRCITISGTAGEIRRSTPKRSTIESLAAADGVMSPSEFNAAHHSRRRKERA